MEAYAQTVPTPPMSEEDQQGTPLMSKPTEHILPDVDPSLSIKKEVEVKVETSQVVQGAGDTLVCGVRRQCFATMGSRKLNIRPRHEGELYTSQDCDKLFTQKVDLKRHIKSGHRLADHSIPISRYDENRLEDRQVTPSVNATIESVLPHVDPSLTIKQEDTVKVEERSLAKGENPECRVWRGSFTTVGNWNPHITNIISRLHEGTSYTCQVCDRVFSYRGALKRHIQSVHQGAKPHHCGVCDKFFSRKAHLFLHIRTVHNGEKPHRCPVCGRGFGERGTLTHHIRVVHAGQKPHQCSDCGKTFARTQGVQRHMKVCNNG